jgi:hypothetical protein
MFVLAELTSSLEGMPLGCFGAQVVTNPGGHQLHEIVRSWSDANAACTEMTMLERPSATMRTFRIFNFLMFCSLGFAGSRARYLFL